VNLSPAFERWQSSANFKKDGATAKTLRWSVELMKPCIFIREESRILQSRLRGGRRAFIVQEPTKCRQRQQRDRKIDHADRLQR
jgi:hypothetical protein